MTALLAFFYIISPVADMRENPDIDSQIVSQAYFSEQVRVLEDQDEWAKIETCVDKYAGWIQKDDLYMRDDLFLPDSTNLIAKVTRRAAHAYDFEDTVFGPEITLPFESQLRVIEPLDIASKSRWLKVAMPDDSEVYIQRGDIQLNPGLISREEMCTLSKEFLGLPYTWGGRSSFGYDCSGFVQMLYRQMGIFLPRDSKDQVKSSLFVETSLSQLQPGDLIFFGLEEGKIRHVGMYLGDDQFIHSTVAENQPYIRISQLSSSEWSGGGRFKYRTFRTLA
jgi:gamma-D-glutamyl-L-lysine dipeptidyl-peptidase